MTKAEIEEKLTSLGIEYPATASKNELIALLEEPTPTPEPTPEAPVEGVQEADEAPKDEPAVEPEPAPVAAPVAAGSFKVVKHGLDVRTYTSALHGESAKTYATQFAQKIGGTVVSS